MKCDICSENEQVYTYTLNDGSSIGICQTCGEIVYNKVINYPYSYNRLFQIIALIEYVEKYKETQHALSKTLVRK